ncbi:MAG: hypothetical protein ACOYT4_03525 [Nanoarchaeota archaeon]
MENKDIKYQTGEAAKMVRTLAEGLGAFADSIPSDGEKIYQRNKKPILFFGLDGRYEHFNGVFGKRAKEELEGRINLKNLNIRKQYYAPDFLRGQVYLFEERLGSGEESNNFLSEGEYDYLIQFLKDGKYFGLPYDKPDKIYCAIRFEGKTEKDFLENEYLENSRILLEEKILKPLQINPAIFGCNCGWIGKKAWCEKHGYELIDSGTCTPIHFVKKILDQELTDKAFRLEAMNLGLIKSFFEEF